MKRASAYCLAIGACFALALGCHRVARPLPWPETDGLLLGIANLNPSDTRLLQDLMGDTKIHHGGLLLFEPGQTAHPEPRHVHEADEVFIIVQGKGILPIEGKEYPVKTGDVAIVKANKDHHLRSSEDDPLIVAWYVMEK